MVLMQLWLLSGDRPTRSINSYFDQLSKHAQDDFGAVVAVELAIQTLDVGLGARSLDAQPHCNSFRFAVCGVCDKCLNDLDLPWGKVQPFGNDVPFIIGDDQLRPYGPVVMPHAQAPCRSTIRGESRPRNVTEFRADLQIFFRGSMKGATISLLHEAANSGFV